MMIKKEKLIQMASQNNFNFADMIHTEEISIESSFLDCCEETTGETMFVSQNLEHRIPKTDHTEKFFLPGGGDSLTSDIKIKKKEKREKKR